jgi:hypothetical protein
MSAEVSQKDATMAIHTTIGFGPALPLWSRQAAFAEELARGPIIAHAVTKQLDR